MNDLRMELKVCEGCGALWLRAGCSGAGSTLRGPAVTPTRETALRHNVYCKSCVRMFASFPAARGPRKNSRIRIRTRKTLGLVSPVAVASQAIHNAIEGGAR